MDLVAASATTSSEADTPQERADRELKQQTDENTERAAKESVEMRQFRLDIKDRVERTYCHKEQRSAIRLREEGKQETIAQAVDNDTSKKGKRPRRSKKAGSRHEEEPKTHI